MTRPIMEPKIERDLARAGYSSRQLFRRPSVAQAESIFAAFGQLEVSGTTGANNLGVLATKTGDEYVTPDQDIIEITERSTVAGQWGIQANLPGIYVVSLAVRIPTMLRTFRLAISSLTDTGPAPGIMSSGYETWVDPNDAIAGGDKYGAMSALVQIHEDSGSDDWNTMAGGHDFPLRFTIGTRNFEAVSRAASGFISVGFIREESPF